MGLESASSVQTIQTAHRWRLAEIWNIEPGSSLLELGCGQGDMTAVLAEAVGPSGRVVAVDIASPEYGAPETLREATDIIRASAVGSRVEFRFQFDPLDPANDWGEGAFDDVVLAHSSWYFATRAQLAETLARAHCCGQGRPLQHLGLGRPAKSV